MNGYQFTKAFYDEIEGNEAMQQGCTAHHHSLYTWICELRNRVKRDAMDLPREYTMQMAFIGSPIKFKKCVEDLAEWGIIEILKGGKDTNQHAPTKIKFACSFMNKHDTSTEPASNEQDTDSELASNTTKSNKTNKSSKSKRVSNPDSFEAFWGTYDKKVGRKKCETKWNNLAQKTQQEILENVPLYVQANPDPEYRKNPQTYLNGECWKDPIVTSSRVIPLNGGTQKKAMVY